MIERYTATHHARFNIAHQQVAPVQLADGERALRWGLLAPWQGHGGKRGPMVFAATEADIARTPHLRTARAKRRALVLADGFYAWRKLGKKRQPYWVHAPAPVTFAAIVATHKDDAVESFALVLVPAIAPGNQVIDAMPAVVDARWLDAPDLVTLPLDGWRADAVSNHVDDETHDDPRCIETLGNPAQGELF